MCLPDHKLLSVGGVEGTSIVICVVTQLLCTCTDKIVSLNGGIHV